MDISVFGAICGIVGTVVGSVITAYATIRSAKINKPLTARSGKGFEKSLSERQKSMIEFCEKYGIQQFTKESLNVTYLFEELYKRDTVYLVGTSCGNLVPELSKRGYLKELLLKGKKIVYLTPFELPLHDSEIETNPEKINNCSSKVVREVGNIEHNSGVSNASRPVDIEKEYINALCCCVRAIRDAENYNQILENSIRIGEIYVGCISTLIRQTVTLGASSDNKDVWGFLSVTMPPRLSIYDTFSYQFCGNGTEKHTEPYTILNHVQALEKFAKNNNKYIKLNDFVRGE